MMRVLPEKRKIIVVLDGPGGYFYSHPLFSRTRINLKKLSINLKITTYYIADLPPSLTAIPFFSHSSIPIYFSKFCHKILAAAAIIIISRHSLRNSPKNGPGSKL